MGVVLISVAAFYGGMQYQKSQPVTFAGGQLGGRNGNFQGQMGTTRPISGEIISQDDSSITVKMQDGSTKIVILSDKTAINKSTTGIKADLKIGEKVTAFGTTNSDGTVTAQNVSIGGMIFRAGPGGGGR